MTSRIKYSTFLLFIVLGLSAGCNTSTGPTEGPGCEFVAEVTGSPFQGQSYGYEYNICNVPDIDQVKAPDSPAIAGLPNDGRCYCVPTSALNWFSYLAQNGFAQLRPGSEDYQQGPPNFTERYNKITTYQAILGGSAHMSLNPGPSDSTGGCGVGPDSAVPSMLQWIEEDNLASSISVTYVGENEDTGYIPRIGDAALQALLGGFIMPRIGWYADTLGTGVMSRTGGHVVSLVHASGQWNPSSGFGVVALHDPARTEDGDEFSQSTFVRHEYSTVDVFESYETDNGNVNRRRTRIMGYSNDRGRMDGFYSIMPKYGLISGADGGIQMNRPFVIGSLFNPETQTNYLEGVRVSDAVILPHRTIVPYLEERSDVISGLDLLTDRTETLAELPGVKRIVFGGTEGRLYALSDNGISSFNTTEWDFIQQIATRVSFDEMAFDPANNRLVALDTQNGAVHYLSTDLEPAGSVVIRDWPGGSASMTVDRRGRAWLLQDGTSNTILISESGTVSAIEMGDGRELTGIYAGDDNRLYAIRNGQVVSFHYDGGIADDTPFDGQDASSWIRISQSWNNVNPEKEIGPGWDNVLPD